MNVPELTSLPPEWRAGEVNTPGAVRLLDDRPGCERVLVMACPGCGRVSGMRVGLGAKPADSPSWRLDGNPDDPKTWTLSPSIHCKGCCGWHGYLKNGVYSLA